MKVLILLIGILILFTTVRMSSVEGLGMSCYYYGDRISLRSECFSEFYYVSMLVLGVVLSVSSGLKLIIDLRSEASGVGAGAEILSRADLAKWKALTEFDEEIGVAAAKARAVSAAAERELAKSYLVLNDKTYLKSMLDKVLLTEAKVLPESEVVGDEGLAQNPAEGEIGGEGFLLRTDGKYVITTGPDVGRTFDSYSELQAAYVQ